MKYISIFSILLFVFVPDMFASGYDGAAHSKVVSHVSGSLGILFFFMKILGFIILISALIDLISSGNGKSGSDKFVNSSVKIILSASFVGVEKLYQIIIK